MVEVLCFPWRWLQSACWSSHSAAALCQQLDGRQETGDMRGTLTTFSCALLLAATSQAGAEVRLPSFLDNLLDSLGPEDGRQGPEYEAG